jgi:hypothetical protein
MDKYELEKLFEIMPRIRKLLLDIEKELEIDVNRLSSSYKDFKEALEMFSDDDKGEGETNSKRRLLEGENRIIQNQDLSNKY